MRRRGSKREITLSSEELASLSCAVNALSALVGVSNRHRGGSVVQDMTACIVACESQVRSMCYSLENQTRSRAQQLILQIADVAAVVYAQGKNDAATVESAAAQLLHRLWDERSRAAWFRRAKKKSVCHRKEKKR